MVTLKEVQPLTGYIRGGVTAIGADYELGRRRLGRDVEPFGLELGRHVFESLAPH